MHEEERRPPQTRSLPRGFSPLTEDPDLRPQHGTSPPLLLRRHNTESSFKQSFLNGTPKKKKENKWWTRAQRDENGEIDQRKNNKRRRGGGKKKQRQDEAMEQRSEGLQRNVVSRYEKTLSRWGKCLGRQVGKKESEVGPNPKK